MTTSKTSKNSNSKKGGNKKIGDKPQMKITKSPASKPHEEDEKNKYESRMIAAIDGIDEKLKDLRVESSKLRENAKEKLDEQIIFLSRKKDELEHSLKDFRENSGEKWEDFKEGAEKKIEELEEEAKQLFEGMKSGFNYLLAKFKKN